MKCEELLKQINEYVDGQIEPGVCDELREHLEGCESCRVVVDNIRSTITVLKDGKPLEMPAECREKLRKLLEEKWRKTFPGSK